MVLRSTLYRGTPRRTRNLTKNDKKNIKFLILFLWRAGGLRAGRAFGGSIALAEFRVARARLGVGGGLGEASRGAVHGAFGLHEPLAPPV